MKAYSSNIYDGEKVVVGSSKFVQKTNKKEKWYEMTYICVETWICDGCTQHSAQWWSQELLLQGAVGAT